MEGVMIFDFIKTLWRTLYRHPLHFLWQGFVAFSVFWTFTEATYHFSTWESLKGGVWLSIMLITSVIYAFVSRWQTAKVVIPVRQSNVSIEVFFGDIFECDGMTAIPVSEYFDSEFGLPVSPNSLHGIFINKCFGGHPQAFDAQVAAQLAGVQATQTAKVKGKTACYPIGTSAVLGANGKSYILFALTHADPQTCKASANVPLMFEALSGLWKHARTHLNGSALNLPLVGSGPSGVGLPAIDLVNILVLSFIDETKRQIVTQKLRIILTWDRLDEVDLRQLKKYWEEK